MAWNAHAHNAWTTSPNKTPTENDSTSFPGLKPTKSAETARVDLSEIQKDELLALEAIYADDFVNHTGEQSAWKVTSPTIA